MVETLNSAQFDQWLQSQQSTGTPVTSYYQNSDGNFAFSVIRDGKPEEVVFNLDDNAYASLGSRGIPSKDELDMAALAAANARSDADAIRQQQEREAFLLGQPNPPAPELTGDEMDRKLDYWRLNYNLSPTPDYAVTFHKVSDGYEFEITADGLVRTETYRLTPEALAELREKGIAYKPHYGETPLPSDWGMRPTARSSQLELGQPTLPELDARSARRAGVSYDEGVVISQGNNSPVLVGQTVTGDVTVTDQGTIIDGAITPRDSTRTDVEVTSGGVVAQPAPASASAPRDAATMQADSDAYKVMNEIRDKAMHGDKAAQDAIANLDGQAGFSVNDLMKLQTMGPDKMAELQGISALLKGTGVTADAVTPPVDAALRGAPTATPDVRVASGSDIAMI